MTLKVPFKYSYRFLIYINLHYVYGSNLIKTFWGKIQNMKHFFFLFFSGSWGPNIKSRGTKMPANADLITVGTYATRENIWQPVFQIWVRMWKQIIWCVCGGGELQWLDSLFCFPAILSPISMIMSNKETIWYFIAQYDVLCPETKVSFTKPHHMTYSSYDLFRYTSWYFHHRTYSDILHDFGCTMDNYCNKQYQ